LSLFSVRHDFPSQRESRFFARTADKVGGGCSHPRGNRLSLVMSAVSGPPGLFRDVLDLLRVSNYRVQHPTMSAVLLVP